MGLEISRITDCTSWHIVVGMECSTVFDKCPSPVNWKEPKKYPELQGIGGVDGTRTRDPRRDRPVF